MDSGLYVVGNRMNGLTQELQAVASNMANANSSGFKRMVSSFAGQVQAASLGGAQSGSLTAMWPQLGGPKLDTSQGTLRRTNRPLDLAIQGKAFFAVATPEGARYTRKGRLYRNSQGELVDAAGNPYMADSGSLRIPEGVSNVTVGRDGQVTADEQQVGRLMLMDIPRTDMLVPTGAGQYRNDGPTARPASGSEVIQGVVEESNVKPTVEMVALINVMRAYEAGARVLKKMDKLGGDLVNSAG